eukprot:gb/GECG01005466.1/.p1 GENE.gb/GECG01005466.1/~~gb/GECG01005466.1/.p1  ORF type:complete len:355 (+),score=31.20 gb/GECG01005466.1/:1-1065(+)
MEASSQPTVPKLQDGGFEASEEDTTESLNDVEPYSSPYSSEASDQPGLRNQSATRNAKPRSYRNGKAQRSNRWRRVLYENQGYPDDYLDDTFLASLVTNANVQYHGLWSMIKSTTAIINKISLLAIVLVVFLHVQTLQPLEVMSLIVLDLVCALFAIVVVLLLPTAFRVFDSFEGAVEAAWQGIIFLAALIVVSPVLQTLTQSFSDDTMWALTILFSAIHMIFHDYKNPSFSHHFDGALSLNAGMFATVLLASRLPSVQHVYFFTLCAIEVFALAPVALDFIEVKLPQVKVPLSILLSLLTFCLLRRESTLICILYVAGMFFICIVCPIWFTFVMQYKSEIQGPWDVAKVTALG